MRIFLIHIILFVLPGSLCIGQVDTVQVSRDYKTILVFPSGYDFAINGKDLNFIESFPKNSSSQTARNVVMVSYNSVAPNETDWTNYTVYTTDGLAYDFILELVAIPSKKRWPIDVSMADNKDQVLLQAASATYQRGNSSVTVNESTAVSTLQNQLNGSTKKSPDFEMQDNGQDHTTLPITLELYGSDKKEYIRRRCYYNQFNKAKVMRYFARSGDVFLWLGGVYYDNNEIYIQFRIENRENIDYDLNFLRFNIATNYRYGSNNEKLKHRSLYRYKVPERIKGNSENHFFVVFDKFTLDRKKVLLVDMDEEGGSRNISLAIDHELINKPLSF